MRNYAKLITIVVIMLITMKSTCSHRHRRYHSEEEDSVPRQDDVTLPTNTQITPMQEKIRIKNSLERGDNVKGTMPFNPKRLEKMLEKAIFKIITGDLSSADMLLLKSLNYSLEQVLAIREREFDKKRFEDEKRVKEIRKNSYNNKNNDDDDWMNKKNTHAENQAPSYYKDFEAYNRQAVIDYENLASKTEAERDEMNYEDDKSTMIDYDKEAMEPRVIFKIRYDDSEFDSSSDEVSKERLKNTGHSFLGSTAASSSIPPSVYTDIPVVYRLNDYNSRQKQKHAPVESSLVKSTTESYSALKNTSSAPSENTETIVVHRVDEEQPIDNKEKKVSEYEGLEWVEDDVYRVIPSMAEAMDLEDKTDNETSSADYDDSSDSSYRFKHRSTSFSSKSADNDMIEYQNDTPDPIRLFMASANISEDNVSSANLSAYQQLAMEHRRDQGKKAIEEIKMKVLAFTGRFNLSSNVNQVQPKKLTMFKPSCRIPDNTDPEAWADPFLMNMYFELNVSTSEHVVAAKLRIFQLPQQNLTNTDSGNFEDVKKVKKIRISVSYYTKSLKKHRSKKRLMDSFVTSLIPEGNHLALDVKDSLEYWGLNPRNSRQGGNGGNHGLVIQVEDQDERPLKPSLYIQQSSCSEHNEDEKTNVYLPFSSEPVLDMFESLMENQ